MPIRYTRDPATPEDVKDAPEEFIVFYSSRDEDGRLWCPDCRDVEDLVHKTFSPSDGPAALIVWVGQKPEWKAPSNPFRAQPWNVGTIPTVVRVKDGARLVEAEIQQGLTSFAVIP